jgi:RNA polymerase sigma-70 factor (ECF subfamily)
MGMASSDFEVFYRRHASALRRFVSFLGADSASVDDIIAETFARVWTSTARIQPVTAKAYLFTIAHNLHRRAAKRMNAHVQFPADWVDDAISAERRAEGRSDLEAVMAAMSTLAQDDRAAILMRATDQLSYEEIAGILGLSVPNAKVRVHRARLKLARAIQPTSREGEFQ